MTILHPRFDIRIFMKECVSLSKAGNDVILLVNDNIDNEVKNGVKIISIKKPFRTRFHRFFFNSAGRKIFNEAKKLNADVYHFHDPELIRIGIKLKKIGFKVIYDSHEDVPRQIHVKEWIPKILRYPISFFFEIYENKSCEKFDAIIVPTPHLKERFKNVSRYVYEVCNFPSIDDFERSGVVYSNKNDGIYVGDLSRTRGIQQIALASQKAGLGLKLCGNFHSKNLKVYLSNNFDNVKYKGYLSRTEIAQEITSSSMGFVTLLNTANDSYSYPIKMFEYMAAGIPVIASNFDVYKSIIEEHDCGICVDPTNVNDILKAIDIIKNDYDTAYRFSLNGQLAIKNFFNWENQSLVLLQCYEEIYNN